MIASVKLLVLALATAGIATSGALAHVPLEKAIEIQKEKLGPESSMPEQSQKGLQIALDNLVANQERWLQEHTNATQPEWAVPEGAG
ncbi:MAG: hypothetical protein ACUVT7_01080 [Thermoplasmata archaeon]